MYSFRGGVVTVLPDQMNCVDTKLEAPPTGCEGPCWGLGDLGGCEKVSRK